MEANMDERSVYERELLSTIARIARGEPGISDADSNGEYEAQRHFYAALGGFRDIVTQCANLSDIQRDNFNELLAVMEDYCPDRESWDEKIAAEKMGY